MSKKNKNKATAFESINIEKKKKITFNILFFIAFLNKLNQTFKA
jgi:hypothetical protein